MADPLSSENSFDISEAYFNGLRKKLQNIQDRFVWDRGGLLNQYLEGRSGLACELQIISGSGYEYTACARLYAASAIGVHAPVDGSPRCGYASNFCGREKKAVLVDIAELVEGPDGVTIPTLVCLYFSQKNGDGIRHGLPYQSCFDLTFEIVGTIGIGKLSFPMSGEGNHRIVEGTAKIADGIANDEVETLVRLMERIKNNFNAAFPLVRFDPQSIKVCRQKGSDLGLYIRDVLFGPSEFGMSV